MLKDLFGGKELRNSINPDEAVAYGAAVHGAVLSGDKFLDKMVRLKDVTPLSLGVEKRGGRFSVVIPKNTPIPCEMSRVHCTVHDNQERVKFKVYQGERPLVEHNHYLNKKFTIDVPPRPARKVKMNVTFRLDVDGLLTVTCVEKSTGERRQVTVGSQEARLSEKEIQEMIEKAERYRNQDLVEKERIENELRRKLVLH